MEKEKVEKGPSAGEVKIQEAKRLNDLPVRKRMRDITDLIDTVAHCARKVTLITECICKKRLDDEPLDNEAMSGLHFVLNDLEDDLDLVVDQYYNRLHPSIAEKKEALGNRSLET